MGCAEVTGQSEFKVMRAPTLHRAAEVAYLWRCCCLICRRWHAVNCKAPQSWLNCSKCHFVIEAMQVSYFTFTTNFIKKKKLLKILCWDQRNVIIMKGYIQYLVNGTRKQKNENSASFSHGCSNHLFHGLVWRLWCWPPFEKRNSDYGENTAASLNMWRWVKRKHHHTEV